MSNDISSMLEYYLCGCAILVCSILGILGNTVCILVFKLKRISNSSTFTNLIVWLAVIDLVFLILVTLTFSLPSLCAQYKSVIFPIILPSLLPLTSVTLTCSVYCVVTLALERYLHLSTPTHSNRGSFFGYILPVMVFSLFYNGPKFFEFTTQYRLRGDSDWEPYVQATQFRKNVDYSFYVLGSNFIFMGVIPVSILISLTILISRRVNQYFATVHMCDQSMSVLLYSIVVVQIVCHTPRTALNVYEIYQALTTGELYLSHPWLVDLSHLMLAVSSASNVVICTLQDMRFRTLLVNDLKKVLFLYRSSNSSTEELEEEEGLENTEENLLDEKHTCNF